jgi:hypothetical protein
LVDADGDEAVLIATLDQEEDGLLAALGCSFHGIGDRSRIGDRLVVRLDDHVALTEAFLRSRASGLHVGDDGPVGAAWQIHFGSHLVVKPCESEAKLGRAIVQLFLAVQACHRLLGWHLGDFDGQVLPFTIAPDNNLHAGTWIGVGNSASEVAKGIDRFAGIADDDVALLDAEGGRRTILRDASDQRAAGLAPVT